MTKICCKCRVEKSILEYHKSSRDGFAPLCKPCAIQRAKDWSRNNRERANQQSRDWKKSNPEKSLEIKRNYRIRHRDRLNAEARIAKSKNREERCARQRERQKERMLTDPIFALTRTLR